MLASLIRIASLGVFMSLAPSVASAACISITSPASGATVSGTSVAIRTSDTCSGVWFESLVVDGASIGTFATGSVVLNSTSFSNGSHTIKVNSQSQSPGSVVLGSAQITLNIQNATPTPTPSCVQITSPASGATVSGSSVAVHTTDTCSGVWFESLYVDGSHVADYASGAVVLNSTSFGNGSHTVKVTSQSQNPSSVVLGSAQITVSIQNATPTPTPAPTPTPVPSCVSIISPSGGATVSGTSVAINTTDTCSGVWYESLYVDGSHVADFAMGSVVFNSTTVANGNHTVKVTSQSQNPGSVVLGSTQITVNAQNSGTPAPTPTPTPGGTVTFGHFSTLAPGSSLPTGPACASAVDAHAVGENAPWNQNDGTGYNSNVPPSGGVPSYFYQYATPGNMPTSDFATVDGNYSGTTDDIVRVYACKWGIDEDVIRAQMMNETGWHQDCAILHGGTGCNENGDYNNPNGCNSGLPTTSITPGGQFCSLQGFGPASSGNQYASWSIIQIKAYYFWWSWPMLAYSTPFALDLRYAEMRACMNGDQYSYFNSQSSTSGADYQKAVANAKSNPNGLASSSWGFMVQPNETWLQYVQWGCFGTHFSGDWYWSDATSYIQEGYGHYTKADWPGGLK